MPNTWPKAHHLPIGSLFSRKSYPLGRVRVLLAMGSVLGVVIWKLLEYFFPFYQFPAFSFVFPAALFLCAFGATFFWKNIQKRLPDLLFFISTACYFCLVYVSFLNKLSYEFLVTIVAYQILMSISFRYFRYFLVFAGVSLAFLAGCIWLVNDLLPPRILTGAIFFSTTAASGLYVGVKSWRSGQQIRFGETLNQLLDSSTQAILLFDNEFQSLLYANAEGWQIWEALRVNHKGLAVVSIFLKLGIEPEAIRLIAKAPKDAKTPLQVNVQFSQNRAPKRYSFTSSHLTFQNQETIMVSMEDITRQYAQEAAIEYGSLLNNTLIQAMPDLLLTLDTKANVVSVRMSEVWKQDASELFKEGINLISWAKERFSSEDLLKFTACIDKAFEGNSQHFNCWTADPVSGNLFLEFRISRLPNQPDLMVVVRNNTHAKTLEQNTQKADFQYRQLFESAPAGVLIVNSQSMVIEDGNPLVCRLLETDRTEITGQRVEDFIPADQLPVLSSLSNFHENQPSTYQETIFQSKKGTRVEVELTIRPLSSGQHPVVMLVVRDIRESKAQQMQVQRYMDLFQNLDVSVVLLHLDKQSGEECLRLTTANDLAIRELDFEEADLNGVLLSDIKPQWDFFKGPELIKKSIEENSICKLINIPYPDSNFQIGYWNIKIVPLPENHAAVIFESTTKQKQAEDKLKSQAHLVAHVSDAIVSVSPHFIIQSWNPAAESIYGWTEHEALGKHMGNLLGNTFIGSKQEEVLSHVLAHGNWSGEGVHTSKYGKKVYVSASAQVVYDSHKKPGQIVIVNRDISQRKLWEEQMKQSERKFRDLFNFSPEAIMVVTPEKHVLDANPIALKMLKSTRTKMVGISLNHLIPASNLYEFNVALQEVLSNKTAFFDTPFMAMDGTVFTAEFRARSFDRNGENAIILHISDISERISAEGKLLLFQSLMNHSTDVIFIVNYRTGKVVYSNEQTWKQLGYPTTSIPDLHLFDLFVTLDHYPLPIRQLQQVQINRSEIFSGRLIRKDRTSYPVEINMGYLPISNQEYLICIARDITERMFQEELLRQNELRYRTLVENMNEGLILTDVEETVLFVNESLCRIFGMKKEELEGKRTYHLFSQELRDIIMSKNALRLEGVADKYELQFTHGDGKLVWLEIAGSPFKDDFNDVTGTIAIVNDITERKRSEELLLEKNNELDAFAYKASHDLRSPLTTIQGITTLARLQKGKEDPEVFYQLIDTTSARLSNILEELEEVARIRKSETELVKIDLQSTILEIFDQIKLDVRSEGVALYHDLKIDSPLEIDSRLFRSILSNILLNSVLYQRKAEQNPFVKVSAYKAGKDLILVVEDNGQGIKPEIRQRVFEMFFRGNHQSKGSGLGLYIVKNAVEKLGGVIRLDSQEGLGTTVHLRIPIQPSFELVHA